MTPGRPGRTAFVAALLAPALLLTGCQQDDPPPREEASATPTPSPTETSGSPEPTPTPSPTPQGRCPLARHWQGDGTKFGTNVSTSRLSYPEALDELDRTFGTLGAVRLFDPTVPPHDSWARRGPLVQGRTVVHSFRMPPAQVLAGRFDEELHHYFATVPQDITLFWSYYHEVEPVIDSGQFDAATFQQAFRYLVRLAKKHCLPNAYPTLVLTGHTQDPASGRDWRTYYPGDDYVSVLAWDPYNSASSRPVEYAPPEELFARVIEASEQAGKPWGIAETGSQLIASDPRGTGRAAWLRDVGEYLRDQGAVFVTYYHSIGVSGADYRLQDRPSIRAWRRLVR